MNEEPSGYFERIILGETVSNADGKYERRYSSSLLPAGLLLDSKEDYGKDKASLYAEAYEEKYNKKKHKIKEAIRTYCLFCLYELEESQENGAES